ncbi:hypothetical protein [Humisphaera borealis]|uniref:PEP-CTERM sorting domain-containing protein n=1 Tax=Humisphaera borealis TaxID=2807512 RepID=A0A7M2X4D0_9BACT|nr:hypothetical protein [Humisphaera borealis]QOV91620.1 hypothetical protein IPV69_09760 [Humisphaera borealis]
MRSIRSVVVLAIVGCLGLSVQTAEGALAQAAGGSGLSGTLSKNKAIRKQQLIADPTEPVYGSISVTYDPNVVSISGLLFGPGYNGFAQVELSGDGTFLTDLNDYLAEPFGTQTGYVQVTFFEPGVIGFGPSAGAGPSTHGQITPPVGYTTTAVAGPAAVDTHALFFDYLPTVPDNTIARYTIFADPGTRNSGNEADFLNDGTTEIPANQIAPASVSGSLDSPALSAVPVPPAVWMGGITMLGSLLYGKLRRRVAA